MCKPQKSFFSLSVASYLWEWPSMTERMAHFFGLDSCNSLLWSASKNAWQSLSDGLISGQPGPWSSRLEHGSCLWEKLMLQISSYGTHLTEFILVWAQAQGFSVQACPFLISAAANTEYRRAAAWEQTSPRPALQVQWAISTVPSSWTVIQGCVGVRERFCECLTLNLKHKLRIINLAI